MAHFDEAVPPGGEGGITLQIETDGYHGTMKKSARVYSNDPERNVVRLSIKAKVKAAIDYSPRFVYLNAKVNQSVTRTVEIKAGLDRSLELDPVDFTLADKLDYSIRELEKGRRFEILFTTRPAEAQTYRGYLKLETNYPEKKNINIRIRGRIVGEN